MNNIKQEQERTGNRAATGWWVLVLLFVFAMLMASCNTEKKVNDWSIKNPDKFKTLAAIIAPCVDVNPKSDTIYRSKTDTLVTPGNTIIEHRNDTVFITKQLPGRVITKTEVQTVTKTVADSRMLDACAIKSRAVEDELLRTQTQLKQKSEAKNTWMWLAIGCIAFIVVAVVIKVYTQVTGAWKGIIK